MADPNGLEEVFAALVEKVGQSVVRIGRSGGRGAGVVVEGGHVLTNAHNLRADTTTVTYADGRSVQGRVLGADFDGDLALLETGSGDAAAAIAWEPHDEPLALGQAVFAVTRTVGGDVRVTTGYVSAVERTFRGPRGRRIRGGFEHTAPVGPGSSGGPVVDAEGRLVGIDTHRLEGGFYLAVRAGTELADRVAGLRRGEVPQRPRLGVGLAPAEVSRRMRRAVGLPARDGVLVRVVEDGSSASRAGVREGDLLVRLGERDLASADDLLDALVALGGATTFELSLVRGVEDVALQVDLAERATAAPEDPAPAAG